MQEWIIAMLVISVLLIIAGHGKNYFDGENVKKRRSVFYCVKSIPRKKRWNAMRPHFRSLQIRFMECPIKKNF